MGICQRCLIDYPEGLVFPFYNGREYEPLCGICALKQVNVLGGKYYSRFDSPVREEKRQAALAFRASPRVTQTGER